MAERSAPLGTNRAVYESSGLVTAAAAKNKVAGTEICRKHFAEDNASLKRIVAAVSALAPDERAIVPQIAAPDFYRCLLGKLAANFQLIFPFDLLCCLFSNLLRSALLFLVAACKSNNLFISNAQANFIASAPIDAVLAFAGSRRLAKRPMVMNLAADAAVGNKYHFVDSALLDQQLPLLSCMICL